jgi:hypothetical protein
MVNTMINKNDQNEDEKEMTNLYGVTTANTTTDDKKIITPVSDSGVNKTGLVLFIIGIIFTVISINFTINNKGSLKKLYVIFGYCIGLALAIPGGIILFKK